MLSDPPTSRSARIYKGCTDKKCKIDPIYRDPHACTDKMHYVSPPGFGRSVPERSTTFMSHPDPFTPSTLGVSLFHSRQFASFAVEYLLFVLCCCTRVFLRPKNLAKPSTRIRVPGLSGFFSRPKTSQNFTKLSRPPSFSAIAWLSTLDLRLSTALHGFSVPQWLCGSNRSCQGFFLRNRTQKDPSPEFFFLEIRLQKAPKSSIA